MRFSDALADAIDQLGTPACVGLDPVVEKIPDAIRAMHDGDPVKTIEKFSMGVVDAVAGIVPIVKVQSACYERFGSPGFAAMERVCAHARDKGLLVLLDAKRGDIGISAAHYAEAVTTIGAHAVTVNAYLGPSGVHPFLDRGLGVFALVRTSNPDSERVQSHELKDGRTVAEMMAELVDDIGDACRGARGLSDLGAVVGATTAGARIATSLRERMPDQVFLVPGIGAQGGTIDSLTPMKREHASTLGERGVLPTASRSVIYPGEAYGPDWADAVQVAARKFVRCVS